MSDKLKPCPFCGGDAVLTNERMSDKRFRVGCYNDTCWRPGTDWYDSAPAVADAWNHRVGEPDGAALVREFAVWLVALPTLEMAEMIQSSPSTVMMKRLAERFLATRQRGG
jgi:hypothetical protein